MENFEQNFHEIFLKYGGSYNLKHADRVYSTTINSLYQIIEKLRQRYNKLPNIYVSVIDNSSANAIVDKYKEVYYIGIFHGSLFMLHEVFSLMLSNPLILPEVGNVLLETAYDKVPSIQFTDFKYYLDITNKKTPSRAKCDVRRELALHLTGTALLFLLLHEYGHIVNGHVDYSYRNNESFKFEELLSNNMFNTKEQSLMKQTCEYDADNFANHIMLQELLSLQEYKDFANIPLNKKHIYDSYESSLYYHYFAIYTFFRLSGPYYENPISDLLSLTHPPSGTRQHFIGALINTISQPYGQEYMSRIANTIGGVTNEVEKAFDAVSDQGYNPKARLITFTDRYKDHIYELRKYWKTAQPILNQYAYVKLAPVQENIERI